MAEYLTNDTDLKSVAGAIRAKTGKTDAIAFKSTAPTSLAVKLTAPVLLFTLVTEAGAR